MCEMDDGIRMKRFTKNNFLPFISYINEKMVILRHAMAMCTPYLYYT